LPELLLTRRAKNDLAGLARILQEAVLETLTLIEANPQAEGKELRGRLRGLWSCRVGNYRILYTIDGLPKRPQVIVRTIRHRAGAYSTKSHSERRQR